MNKRQELAAFARGMRQFNARRFWHAHESWETIWLVAPEPEKSFLQGIIQISAAFYHHQRKNLIGTRNLLRWGLKKVEKFPANHRGLRLENLRRTVRTWLKELGSRGTCARRRYPRLRLGALAMPRAPRIVGRKAKHARSKRSRLSRRQ